MPQVNLFFTMEVNRMADINGVEYATIMDAMTDAQIFSISKKGDCFEIYEEAECHFSATLTRSQLKMLGEEIIKLAES